ncbi:MAG: hypothetical protein GF320_05960 [Armatimonadia bacterium]|nr:hypothetical protein [Armatimonadia bacterium]
MLETGKAGPPKMLALTLAAQLIAADASAREAPPPFAEWGLEAIEIIRRDLYLSEKSLYADKMTDDGPSGPAFMWGCGVMLSALNGAAAVDPSYRPWLVEYVHALERYWSEEGPVPGLDVLPTPKPVDRYYDDNAWVVIALVESADLLGGEESAHALDFAQRTMDYVLSGEDATLGGGIYWRESDKASKNTCSNSPSAVAAYLLYQATGDDGYRDAGDRLLGWTLQRLQDPADGLMWDNIAVDGSIEKTKWSYNTALTIRALLLAADTGSGLGTPAALRTEASRMADAAIEYWIDPETGAIDDGAAFAHLLAEALLVAAGSLEEPRYRDAAEGALVWLREHGAGPGGIYPGRWSEETLEPRSEWSLMDQASAARGFLVGGNDGS